MPCVRNFKNSLLQIYSPLSAWHRREIDNTLRALTRDEIEDRASAKHDSKLRGEDPYYEFFIFRKIDDFRRVMDISGN